MWWTFMVNLMNNLANLQSQQQLNESKSLLTKSVERLTSGKRVNQAKDNPADFAIGLRLNIGSSSALQSIHNVNDASSVAQVASVGIEIQANLLGRAQELALQAAGNPTLSDRDRGLINNELQSVIEDFNAVAENTRFNGMPLLDGRFNGSFQVGGSLADHVSLNISSSLGASVGAQRLQSDGSILSNEVSAVATAAIATNGVAAQELVVSQNGGSGSATIVANASAAEVASSIGLIEDIGADAITNIQLSISAFSSSNISFSLGSGDSAGVSNTQTITATVSDSGDLSHVVNAINDVFEKTGVTANFATGSKTEITLINEQGENIQIADIKGFDAELTSASGAVTNLLEGGVDSALISGQVSVFSETATGFSIDSISADIFAATTTDSTLASINTVDASTQSGAQDALGVIDRALDQLGGSLAVLGSFQNSNGYRLDQLSTGFQNNTAALGRKVDADFALEVTEQINQQIKFQVNAAVFGVSGNTAKNFLDLLNN
ncbi:hypothetical protein AVI52_01815 [Piscirickettsia salmonis]|nr:hypothetical protein AVI52_01815 [Piscirickettsia salmonis]